MLVSLVGVVRISIQMALSPTDKQSIGLVSEDYSHFTLSECAPISYARSRSSNIINANNIAMTL